MYKKISFRSVPKPGPGNRAGFFIARTRSARKTPWVFLGPDARGPPTQAFSGRRLPAPANPKPAEERGKCPNFAKAKAEIRPAGRRARATARRAWCRTCSRARRKHRKRAAQLAEQGNVAAIRICMNRLSPVGQHNPVAFELPPIHSPQDCLRATSAIRMPHPCHLVGRGGRERERRQAAGGAHDCARQGAPLRPLLLRFVEALSTPVVAPVMALFGGRRDSLFVNPFKQVTKAPCKFHLLQGACSSPVVCSAPLFLPCSLQGHRAATAATGPNRFGLSANVWPRVSALHTAQVVDGLPARRKTFVAQNSGEGRFASVCT